MLTRHAQKTPARDQRGPISSTSRRDATGDSVERLGQPDAHAGAHPQRCGSEETELWVGDLEQRRRGNDG